MIGPMILGAALLAVPSPQQQQQPGEPESAALAEYNGQRGKIPDTADAHWKLGLWAEQKGLKPEATSEFLAVTRLEPSRDAAWKKLGLVKQDGRWLSPEQIAADKLEADAQRKADARWLPILRKAKATLAQKGRQAEAEAALAEVKDPRAIPSIWKVFGQGTADDQERAIDLFAHIEGERASRAIAGLAVFGKTDLVRKAAVETLTRRDPDDVLMLWIGLLQKPVKYEVRQVAGPGSPGVLTVEGAKFNVRRSYSPPSMSQTQALFVDNPGAYRFRLPLQFNSSPPGPPPGSRAVGWNKQNGTLFVFDYTWAPPPVSTGKQKPDPSGPYQSFEKSQLQAQIDRDFEISETAKMADGAQAQLQQDVDAIEAGNATTRELNARLAEALRRVSGKDLGDDKEAWLKWSMERRGYQYVPPTGRPKATLDVQVPLPYVPQAGPPIVTEGGGGGGAPWCMIWEHDKGQKPRTARCFAGGTPVLTPQGPRAIEAIRAGDVVLTADGPDQPPRPGPVRAVHRSKAGRTLALSIGGEAVVTTEGHPLWKVGTGWTRAGDLRAGDEVATRGGRATLGAVEARAGAEVWNLEVDDGATYLVGRSGLVAHDLGPIAEVLDDR